MDIKVTGVASISQKLERLQTSAFANMMMGDIATMLMLRIKDRTLQGEDVDGHSFAPYAESYKKYRQKKGYKTSPVDLSFSGQMLAAMTESHSKYQAELFFMNTSDQNGQSANDKAFWNNEDREFFGLNESDELAVMKIVDTYYNRIIAG